MIKQNIWQWPLFFVFLLAPIVNHWNLHYLKKNPSTKYEIYKAHVCTCQIYPSYLTSSAKKKRKKRPTYTWEEAIKCIFRTVQIVPKARLWNDSSHSCLFNTADLDGATGHVAQTAPASWPQWVWTYGRDREPSWKPRQVRAVDM